VLRDDYLMRLIRQLVDAIAKIAGLNRRGEHDKALSEAARAWQDCLEVPRELVDVMDTPMLAAMLRDPAKMRAAAQLLIEEGRAYAGKRDPVTATRRYTKALELYLEARVIAPEPDDDGVMFELSREAATHLDPRYVDKD
jgi:tetratricopeptide (TPR) repeat protein